MRKYVKSAELFERANEFIPGPHSNISVSGRIPSTFMAKAKGAHVWDVDGNEYIDYICGFGPGILGYGNREFIKKMQHQIESIYFLAQGEFRTPIEIELAEKFVRHVPCADKVRFGLSGTEIIQVAIRLARGYTKRPYFIRFDAHYHGWLDNVLGGMPDDNPVGKPFAKPNPHDFFPALGTHPGAAEESFLLPWNDREILEKCLNEYGKEVAMIIMEPIALNSGCCYPRPGYLERVRELCDTYGIVLCYDEVQTGFRVGLSSAQGVLGVIPDLAVFGKTLGGGIPLGALAGKDEIMRLLFDRKVTAAGTFNGYPLGLAASLANLTILERDGGAIYTHIATRQKRLMDGISDIAQKHGVPFFIQGATGTFFLIVAEVKDKYAPKASLTEDDRKRQGEFESRLIDGGVMVYRGGRWFISAALTNDDVDQTLRTVDRVIATLS